MKNLHLKSALIAIIFFTSCSDDGSHVKVERLKTSYREFGEGLKKGWEKNLLISENFRSLEETLNKNRAPGIRMIVSFVRKDFHKEGVYWFEFIGCDDGIKVDQFVISSIDTSGRAVNSSMPVDIEDTQLMISNGVRAIFDGDDFIFDNGFHVSLVAIKEGKACCAIRDTRGVVSPFVAIIDGWQSPHGCTWDQIEKGNGVTDLGPSLTPTVKSPSASGNP